MLQKYPGDRKLCESHSPDDSSHPPDNQMDHGSEEVSHTPNGLVCQSEVTVPVSDIMSVAIIGIVNGVHHSQESIHRPCISSNSSGVFGSIFTELKGRLREDGPSQSFA